MHHAPEVVGDDQIQLGRLEEALQQQDRLADTGLAQLQALLDAGHGEAIGLGRQRFGTAHCAVAVCVRLDHRERTGAGGLAGQPIVVTKGLQVDQGTGGAHGDGSLFSEVRHRAPSSGEKPGSPAGPDKTQGSAATTDISTRISGSQSLASTVARAGATPRGSHWSQTRFMPSKSASMSFR